MGDRILTVDQGNGSAKIALFEDGVAVASERVPVMNLEEICRICDAFRPDGAVFCSVAREDREVLDHLFHICHGRLLVVTSSTPMRLRIDYASPATLGADRLAAAEGGRRLFPDKGLMIADCGTALTLDVVHAGGMFRGGNISPGLRLRFLSLHDFTSRLPLVETDGELPLMGRDTETAIRCGVVRGTVAEISAMFRLAAMRHGVEALLLTGGDAARLYPLLDEELPGKVIVAGELVSEGLVSIFDYNFGVGSLSGDHAANNDNNCENDE